jgi:4-hydroxybenzoate polyprenyltransferase
VRVAAWVGSTHPLPSLTVASLTTVFAASIGLPALAVITVFFAMLANQNCIGLGNDLLDAEADCRVGRTDKPIAAGVISTTAAKYVSFALAGLALLLSATLGHWPLVCQSFMLAAGWWYNLHAKRHWSSVASYAVGFALLPVFPMLALAPPQFPAWWVVLVSALLGATAHFANALPDLTGDAELGVRGAPQRLGAKVSGLVILLGLTLATAISASAATSVPGWLRIGTAGVSLLGGALAARLAFRPTPPRAIFPIVIVAAVACVIAMSIELSR